MDPSPPPIRHQSSLEAIIDLSSSQPVPLEAGLRARAKDKFYRIVGHFDPAAGAVAAPLAAPAAKYNRPALVRLTYEYSRSDQSKDMFLQAFFDDMKLSMGDQDDADLADSATEGRIGSDLFKFADYLFKYFFVPSTAISPIH